MNLCLDALIQQVSTQGVARVATHAENVENIELIGLSRRQCQPLGQAIKIELRQVPFVRGQGIEVAQLHAEHRCLEFVQPRVDAKIAVDVLLLGAIVAQVPQAIGQRIVIARDDAFAFLYEHLVAGWRALGAELSVFSPLADEAPAADADAVYLPGGYPELHGPRLAAARTFKSGLVAARDRGALIYGECGGYMVLGESLIDKAGEAHAMAGLLPLVTRIDRPRRTLGYRRLAHAGALPWPTQLRGHEFHYSSGATTGLKPLFTASDAGGRTLEPMGAVSGRIMGSYAHVIA